MRAARPSLSLRETRSSEAASRASAPNHTAKRGSFSRAASSSVCSISAQAAASMRMPGTSGGTGHGITRSAPSIIGVPDRSNTVSSGGSSLLCPNRRKRSAAGAVDGRSFGTRKSSCRPGPRATMNERSSAQAQKPLRSNR
jgi:hypothetical protein